jgi:serine/threonine protein kinase
MIRVGTRLTLPSYGELAVIRLIGEGSQGQVFEVRPRDGEPLALKWYLPHTASKQQRDRIAELVERGAPGPRFLWPLAMVDVRGSHGFGYLMPLRPAGHAGLVDLLTGKVDVPFSTVCRLCLELADSFLNIHSQGLCYRDISFSNVFFDPATGKPLICDNDNVGIDGTGPAAVLGTRRFMAPEIVRREAVPSTRTDLYSLSVLLFYILMMGHPLVGRRELEVACWDDQAESMLFGAKPLFVFDPEDRSNAPVPELHDAVLRYWGLYPRFVQELFVQAFTIGLEDPVNGRVRESMWRRELSRLRDTIIRCTSCGRENFADVDQRGTSCWSCGTPLHDPLWLVVERRALALAVGVVVHRHHLLHDYDLDTRLAEVVAHPNNPELLGLRNLTDHTWKVTLADGDDREVGPGKAVRLDAGTVIDFGITTAAIASVLPA